MKSVQLRRHAEKDANGGLTERGIEAAKKLAKTLPKFSKVIASDSDRAQLTAKLLSGLEPEVDRRASMHMASPEKSDAINKLAIRQNIMFLEAIQQYSDPEIVEGTDLKASELNELIFQLFKSLAENEHALIISHDLSISAALAKRNIPPTPIGPLEGYIIWENGRIQPTGDA